MSIYETYRQVQRVCSRNKAKYNVPAREIRPSSPWITSTVVGHFKKEHPFSHSAHKQEAKLVALNVAAGEQGQPRVDVFFTPREDTVSSTDVSPVVPTESVGLNDPPPAQYDLMVDLLDANMFKVFVMVTMGNGTN